MRGRNALWLVVLDADPGVADARDAGRHDGGGGLAVLVEEQADDLVFEQYAAVRTKYAAAAGRDVEHLREPRGFAANDHHARGKRDAIFFAAFVGGDNVHVSLSLSERASAAAVHRQVDAGDVGRRG